MSGDTTVRAYPLPRTGGDDRFSPALLSDVMQVLAEHGYPKVAEGADILGLRQALYRFLYCTEE